MRVSSYLGRLKQSVRRAAVGSLAVAAVIGMVLVSGGPAQAANPTFAIVGPVEWDLPIVPSANVFIQTGIIQSNNREYDTDGNSNEMHGGGNTYVGISRFAHLFSFKSIPKVGFYWEVLVPEMRVDAHGTGKSGIGDPMLALSVYIRPTENSPVKTMFGFQNIVSFPIGNSEVTANSWAETPTFISDISYGKFGIDSTFGASFSSNYRDGDAANEHTNGNMYFFETSLRYQVLSWLAPFVTYNYQNNNSGYYTATDVRIPGSHENVLGGGIKVNFTPNRWLDVWYDRGLAGVNTAQTNAVYFRFVNIF